MKILREKKRCYKCTHKFEKEYPVETTDQLINMINTYLAEWKHRDSMLWKQIFTYFFASLIVMVLPFANIAGFSLAGGGA